MTRNISRRGVIVAGAATGLAGAAAMAARPAVAVAERGRSGDTALTHVTVIDPATGKVLPDTTVVVRGDRITDVGRADQVRRRRRDGRGPARQVPDPRPRRHAHARAGGGHRQRAVRGQRRHHGPRDGRLAARARLARPHRRRHAARPEVHGRQPDRRRPSVHLGPGHGSTSCRSGTRGRPAPPCGTSSRGVPTSSRCTPACPARPTARWPRRRTGRASPFAGHCPDEVAIEEAADLGQASVEHMFWTPFETSRKEVGIRAEIARLRLRSATTAAGSRPSTRWSGPRRTATARRRPGSCTASSRGAAPARCRPSPCTTDWTSRAP